MNFIEALEEVKKGNKVRCVWWAKNRYLSMDEYGNLVNADGYHFTPEVHSLKDEWELADNEIAKLIKDGKLLKIASFCEKTDWCEKCVIRKECGTITTPKHLIYVILHTTPIAHKDRCKLTYNIVNEMYNKIKEYEK